MLRNLLLEVRHRHLWPIPVVALLVAVAAPLMFLKSGPPHASNASTDAATAPTGQLPARAQRLLDTSDGAKRAARRPARNTSDPFQPPSRGTSSGADAAAAGSDSSGAAATKAPEPTPVGTQGPLPVIVTNSDGSPEATPTATGTESTTPASTGSMAVTTRFGRQFPGPVQRSVARLQTFVSGNRVVAIFVKYSPARDKAVFAIAPSTDVTGNVVCRRKDGVCRYVDIAVGKHVRLATRAPDGTLLSHRLDVVRIDDTSQTGATTVANSTPANGSCLLAKLLTMTANDPPLARDAC